MKMLKKLGFSVLGKQCRNAGYQRNNDELAVPRCNNAGQVALQRWATSRSRRMRYWVRIGELGWACARGQALGADARGRQGASAQASRRTGARTHRRVGRRRWPWQPSVTCWFRVSRRHAVIFKFLLSCSDL